MEKQRQKEQRGPSLVTSAAQIKEMSPTMAKNGPINSSFEMKESPQPPIPQWKFVAQLGSPEALDEYRKARGMYGHKMDGQNSFYFFCPQKQCPYKMKAWPANNSGRQNDEQCWQLFERNTHNHQPLPLPMSQRKRKIDSAGHRLFRWNFVRKMSSEKELEEYRKGLGMYAGLKEPTDLVFRYNCSVPNCPYKMKAIRDETGQSWTLFDLNAHNHQEQMSLSARKYKKKHEPQPSPLFTKNELETLLSKFGYQWCYQNGMDQNMDQGKSEQKLKEPKKKKIRMDHEQKPKSEQAHHEAKSESTDNQNPNNGGGGHNQEVIQKSETPNQKPKIEIEKNQNKKAKSEMPNQKSEALYQKMKKVEKNWNQKVKSEVPDQKSEDFELAKWYPEMERIGAKWNLSYKEKNGSFLFVPPRATKAASDGILLALTDRGDHIRMDQFRALKLLPGKLQRWPKQLGRAVILQRVEAQCARLFGNGQKI